jgi:CRP/FNR family transcriptional regulator
MLPLVKIMSRTIARDRNMIFALGKMCAKRRFATFLLDLSARMAQSGYDANELRLCMSRTDIANYLCLALETISRLFTQLQSEHIISVDRRNMKILDMQALQALLHETPGRPLLEKTA